MALRHSLCKAHRKLHSYRPYIHRNLDQAETGDVMPLLVVQEQDGKFSSNSRAGYVPKNLAIANERASSSKTRRFPTIQACEGVKNMIVARVILECLLSLQTATMLKCRLMQTIWTERKPSHIMDRICKLRTDTAIPYMGRICTLHTVNPNSSMGYGCRRHLTQSWAKKQRFRRIRANKNVAGDTSQNNVHHGNPAHGNAVNVPRSPREHLSIKKRYRPFQKCWSKLQCDSNLSRQL